MNIVSAISHDIKVSVESDYQAHKSRPINAEFLFLYRIRIENMSAYTVQLTARHWCILESTGTQRIVEGEGVVGETPVIQPGESFEYLSFCPIRTEVGQMSGWFYMVRQADDHKFRVQVPTFQLIAPLKLN